jgi:hypothetical protein
LRVRASAKQHFNLLRFLNESRREDFHVVDFQGDLLAQLATQRVDRLFTSFHESHRANPNRCPRENGVSEAAPRFVVEDHGAGSDVKRVCASRIVQRRIAAGNFARPC